MTAEQLESYLILKYGTLHKAFHMWINAAKTDITTDEWMAINELFAHKSLRERIGIK